MPSGKAGQLMSMGGCLKSEPGLVGFLGFWDSFEVNFRSQVSRNPKNHSSEFFLVIKLIRLTLPSQNQKVQNAYYTTIGKKRKRNHQG
jgi:hypothetical protein